jgi:hypothetical protein
MRREIAFGILLLGILLLVLGFTRVVPGTIWLGLMLTAGGLLCVGISFIPPGQTETDEPPLTFIDKITRIFYDPLRVFRNLRTHPRWFGAFSVILLCAIIYNFSFIRHVTPEAVVAARIDRIARSGYIPEEQAEQMKQKETSAARSPLYLAGAVAFTGLFIFISLLIVSALYLLGVAMVGGRMSFWQSLAISTYAFLPPLALKYLLSTLLLFFKAPEDIDPFIGQQGILYDHLGTLFSPASQPVLYVLGASIGVLIIYRVWLAVVGLRTVAERVNSAGAWTVALVVWALALGFSLLGAVFSPNFVA